MNLDQFTETTEFRQVARTITALSTQDERIAEEFRIIERKEKPSDRIVHVEGDIPIGSEIDLDEFANSVGVKIWERVRRANWRPFEEARAFARSLGLPGCGLSSVGPQDAQNSAGCGWVPRGGD